MVKHRELLEEGYELALPKEMGSKQVKVLEKFLNACTNCLKQNHCIHLKLDYQLDGEQVHVCACNDCGFCWYSLPLEPLN